MTIATVLALVTDEGESESTLKTAVAIGQKFGAYVEALHVRPQPESVIPVVAGGPSVMSVDMLLEGARASTAERAERAHRLFQDVVLEMSLPLTKVDAEPEVGRFSAAWCETTGIESRAIVRRGRLFDVTVLARPHNGHNQTSSTAMTAALFEMGRPVLITPPKAPATVGQRLMLAWNDTREAAESVWAALPFAAKADEVTVASVIEANSGVDPDELVRALARHGIAASGTVLDRSKAGVGESLLAAADERKCDLLVMGAYGHSRLQELILGGATKHVLNHAQIPLLMVH
jgi:nucleotide-binding universal stress UspA family protein